MTNYKTFYILMVIGPNEEVQYLKTTRQSNSRRVDDFTKNVEEARKYLRFGFAENVGEYLLDNGKITKYVVIKMSEEEKGEK